MKVAVVKHIELGLTETFIHAHADHLPTETLLITGNPPHVYNQPVVPISSVLRFYHAMQHRLLNSDDLNYNRTEQYIRLFSKNNIGAVLAEYGPTGVAVQSACRRLRIPLIVHFHGYDVSRQEVIKQYSERYSEMFLDAAAIIGVSRKMVQDLINLGAPPSKVHYNPCGVDLDLFDLADPSQAPAVFLAVGRMVEKKAPHLLLLAFARALNQVPTARLRLIGDGPLLGVATDLAIALGITHAVEFLGSQSHDTVRREMSRARAFVQHSVVASDGDSEGTPVAVMEASASALPVIGTNHAGISDVVINGETGLLVSERDINGMADAMIALANEPDKAMLMGQSGRNRIKSYFSMDISNMNLWSIIKKYSATK